MKSLQTVLNFVIFWMLLNGKAYANTQRTPNLPLSHCYHWLNESKNKYLTFKYEFAKQNNNELTFFTTKETSNGAVAGEGLYCAKSPSGSYSYGDRVIRIEFVEDVVVLDAATGRQHCGHSGQFYSDPNRCQKKNWDVKLYDSASGWYVIRNPMAIATWTSNSDALVQDINLDAQIADSKFQSHAKQTLQLMEAEDKIQRGQVYKNGNARVDVIKAIQENPKILNSIPALFIASELVTVGKDPSNADTQTDLPSTVRLKHLRQALTRVLTDPSVKYSGVVKILQEPEIAPLFYELIQQIYSNRTQFKTTNSEIAFKFLHNFSNQFSFSDLIYQKILVDVLSSEKSVRAIMEPDFKIDPERSRDLAQKIVVLLNSVQSVDLALLYRKLNLERLRDNDLTQKIDAQLEAIVTSYKTTDKLVLNFGGMTFRSALLPEQVMSQCKAYGTLKLVSEGSITVTAKLPNDDASVNLGNLRRSVTAEVFCKEQKLLLEALIRSSQSDPKIKKYYVTGRIEQTRYFFDIAYLEDVETHIMAFFKESARLDKIDEFYFSINGAESQRQYNSNAYWAPQDLVKLFKIHLARAGAVSRAFMAAQQTLIAKYGNEKLWSLQADLNAIPLTLKVGSLEDISQQCQKFFESVGSLNIDKISVKATSRAKGDSSTKSDEPIEASSLNSNSYWRTTEENCDALQKTIQKLPLPIYSQAQQNQLQKFSKRKFKVEIKMAVQSIALMADNIEEVSDQCLAYLADLKNPKVDRIEVTVNGANPTSPYNRSAYWTLSSEICSQVQAVLLPQIKPKEILKIQAIKSRYKHHLNLSFDKRIFDLYINNSKDLNFQCRTWMNALGAIQLDKIRIEGFGSTTLYRENRSSFWTSPAEYCAQVVQTVFPEGTP